MGCIQLYAQVRARDRVGNIGSWSGNSDGILIDTMPPTVPGTPTGPGPYTSSTSVRFDWTPSSDSGSGVASYDLQVGTYPGGSNIFSGNVGSVLTRTVTGANGQRLYARVRARDRAGNVGAWSGCSNGITIIVPCANNGLAIALGAAKIQCSWREQAKPSGARGWNIHRSASGLPGSYVKINSGLLTNAEYLDTDLKPGSTYYYIVYLGDSEGTEHQWTPPFSATTPLETPAGRWMLYR